MKYLIGCFCILSFFAQAQNTLEDADALYALGNYSKAIEIYKTLPQSESQQMKLAKSYEQTGNLTQALFHYEKVVSTNPNHLFAAYEYAKILKSLRRNSEALEIFSSLQAKDSTNPNFPYQIGLLKESQNDSLFVTHFKKSLNIDPNHLGALVKVATLFIKEKNFKKADSLLKEGLGVDSNNFQVWNLKALNHFYDKKYYKSIEAYDKLIALNRPSENVYQKLGYAYAQTFDYEKSIEYYNKALEDYDDKNPETHYEIAQSYTSLHYFDKAEEHLNTALLLKQPQLEKEYNALLQVYSRQKEYKKSIDLLKEALVYYPDNEFFLYHLAASADNYYADKKIAINYYQNYLKKHSETGKLRLYAKQRISDLKKELFMNSE